MSIEDLSIDLSEFTGERVIPGAVEADLWNEHVARYEFAAELAAERRVLDVGCGTGYGAAIMAERGADAVGIDSSLAAITYARERYGHRARFLVGPASSLGLKSGSFDLVTAFEVIEHVTEWEQLLQECARALHAGGVFVVSTPNKLYYSETRKTAGPNPFHVHEFAFAEFAEALARVFSFSRVLAQNRQEAILFADGRSKRGAISIAAHPVMAEAHFFVAVCAQQPVDVPTFAYAPSAGNLLREREAHITALNGHLAELRGQHTTLLEAHRELEADLEKQNGWAMRLDEELEVSRAELAMTRTELKKRDDQTDRLLRERELVRKSRWIRLGRKLSVGPKLGPEPV